jgi:N-acetylglucosamine-6-sulfatase
VTNTLVLFMDDARADALQCMPRTRRFAREHGVEFRHAWAPSPVCIPSRANLLYGQYASRTNVWAIDPAELDAAELAGTWSESDNLGRWLHDAGTRTAHLGKYHTSSVTPLAAWGWDFVRTIVTQQQQFDATIYDENGDTSSMSRWHSAYMADACMEHIAAADAQPWSILWNTSSPHWPFSVLPEHQWMFMRRPDGHREPQEGDGWPSWIDALDPVTDFASIHNTMRAQYREAFDADQYLASVVEQVDLTETLVIVSSDNGLHYGDHRMTGPGTKNTLYEAASRVPMVMFGAGLEDIAGSVIDSPVNVTDIAATMLAAHDAEAPVPQDGIDLRLIAHEPEDYADRRIFLFHRPTVLISDPLPEAVAVVTPEVKLIHNDATGDDEWELYDLEADPGELVNLADDPGWADVREDLESALTDLLT